MGRQRISEIRQRPQPGSIDLLNQLHDEKWIFGNGIIVFQMNDFILFRGILGHAQEGLRGTSDVWLGVFRVVDMDANARRGQGGSQLDPMLASHHRFLPLGRVLGILAVPGVYSYIHDRGIYLFDRSPEFLEIFGISGWKYRTPGLDFMHIELLGRVCGEVLQFHLLRTWHFAGSLPVPTLPAHNEFAEWISRHCDTRPRVGRELDRGSRFC